ncbi:hypothetical protein C5167_023302 [Papaver somniferum]|uniref:AP180 N-terminal homology (ANTH) domain-containing protein n=1 Tax=Papaver somniferum TaxID=3469 RepID=A0A4Y7JKC7_PAPSO|nr:hypothetical protein C5167_023302 [Papaver somniferum]
MFPCVKYDVETDPPFEQMPTASLWTPKVYVTFGCCLRRTRDMNTIDLLEHLPALQQLLFRVLGCQPQVAAVYNFVIQLALSMVAGESIKI